MDKKVTLSRTHYVMLSKINLRDVNISLVTLVDIPRFLDYRVKYGATHAHKVFRGRGKGDYL